MAAGNGRVRLEGIPAHVWAVAGILLLSLLYVILEVGIVRPRMPAGDEAATLPGVLLTRPPEIAADDPQGLSAIEDWRAGYWSERTSAPRQGFSATHLPKILQVLVFVGVGDRPVRPAEQRLDGVALRAGAGAERRGRGRAAVRVRRHPALWRSADGLHVARRSLRLPHDRPGDPLLPHAVAAADGHARPARPSVHRGGPDDRRRGGDGAVPGRRRQPACCRALGCDASGDVLRLVRRRARHQHAGGGRGGSPLPLQPRRQRAPADPHGALYRRTGRAGLCRQGRTADRGAADRRDAAAAAGSDRDRPAAADPAAGVRPGLRGRRRAGARAARRAAAQPAIRAGEPHADRYWRYCPRRRWCCRSRGTRTRRSATC